MSVTVAGTAVCWANRYAAITHTGTVVTTAEAEREFGTCPDLMASLADGGVPVRIVRSVTAEGDPTCPGVLGTIVLLDAYRLALLPA